MAEGIVARGKKTVVRYCTREDLDKRQAWTRHEDPLYSHNDPRPMTPRERDIWYIEHSASASHRVFAVEDMYGNLVGWLTLRHVNTALGSSVLGIAIEPTRVGMGYGTDALWSFLGYYFGPMGFREMRLDVAAFNERAMRCYEKCGFRYVGEHWTDHPSSLFPPIFRESRYRDVSRYFRRSLLGLELLYRDMALDRAAYLRRRALLEGGEEADAAVEAERVPLRRAAG
jgi:diamine N-acetyltransferase